jgi:hypothetical protein
VTLLDRVTACLDAEGVPHALIGAAALAAAGIARSTFDIDLLTTDRRCLVEAMWDPMKSSGASVDVRRGDESDPLAGVVRITIPRERPVDLIVGRFPWQQRAVSRAPRPAEGSAIVRPADLVLLKLYAGGTQDLWDIQQLLGLPDARDWIDEVDADVGDLPPDAQERWRTLRPA